jgi:aminopeptidase-like protein
MKAIMPDLGGQLHKHVETLFPICRSITGEGLRETLRYIGRVLPLQVREVPSGTRVLDWTVPPEWTIRDAFIATLGGRRVVDFRRHNLHILQYSMPVDRVVTRQELAAHLYSLPDLPDLIPYRTAYYGDAWGFCVADRDRQALTDDSYHVRIDSTLAPGSLSYGECILPGSSNNEVLFSAHCCHPSLANDNLSSIAVVIELARWLMRAPRRYSYRLLFMPGTIGAIAWLHANRDCVRRIEHGLVLTCLGDPAPISYKRTRSSNAAIDRYAAAVLREEGHAHRVHPFMPTGYDERQYCSPGFNLPVGCLMRSPGGTFPEYHTSADNLDLVQPGALADSLRILQRIVHLIERDEVWRNASPYGEPQLGRRGLYAPIGGELSTQTYDQTTLLWVLNLSDGEHSLFDIAERSGRPFDAVVAAAEALANVGLLQRDLLAENDTGQVAVAASGSDLG